MLEPQLRHVADHLMLRYGKPRRLSQLTRGGRDSATSSSEDGQQSWWLAPTGDNAENDVVTGDTRQQCFSDGRLNEIEPSSNPAARAHMNRRPASSSAPSVHRSRHSARGRSWSLTDIRS